MKRADLDRLDLIFNGTQDVAVATVNGRTWATDGIVVVDLTQYVIHPDELADGAYRYIKRSGFRPAPASRFGGQHSSGVSVAARTVTTIIAGNWPSIAFDRDEVHVDLSERGTYIHRPTRWGAADDAVIARRTTFGNRDEVGYVNADRFDALMSMADSVHADAEQPANRTLRFHAGDHTVAALMPLRPNEVTFEVDTPQQAAA